MEGKSLVIPFPRYLAINDNILFRDVIINIHLDDDLDDDLKPHIYTTDPPPITS